MNISIRKMDVESNTACLLGFEIVGRYLRGLAINLGELTRPLLVEIALNGHVMATIRCIGIVRGQLIGRYLPNNGTQLTPYPEEVPGGFEFFMSDYLPLSSPMALRIRAISETGECAQLERKLDLGDETYKSLRPILLERPLVRFTPLAIDSKAITITAFCYGELIGLFDFMGDNCSISQVQRYEAPEHFGFGQKIHGYQLIGIATPIDTNSEARVFLTIDGAQVGAYSDSLFIPPNASAAFDSEAVPMAAQIDRVMASQSKLEYLFSGYASYKVIQDILKRYTDFSFSDDSTILDWGVGCGRVARHFANAGCQIIGIDIDPQNIAWCKKHLAGKYKAIATQPPTSLKSNSVDLVVGLSVFTHLTEADQFLWLAELHRVLKPGAFALVTIQSDYSLLRCPEPTRRFLSLNQYGIDDSVVGTRLNDVIGPQSDYYRETFHRYEYVLKNWGRWFDVVAFDRAAHFSHQDYVVLRALVH